MKRILFPVMTLLLCCSCAKEPDQQGDDQTSGENIRVQMTVQADEVITRLSLNNTAFSWNEGDCIKLRWADQVYASVDGCETLAATNDGQSSIFKGIFSSYKADDNLYAYYSSAGVFASKTSVTHRMEISQLQTGSLDDLKDNLFFYSWIKKSGIKLQKDGDNKITDMDFSTVMSPLFAIVKINIPTSLGYTHLKMEAASAIAGHIQVSPQRTWGTIGSDKFMYRQTGSSYTQSTTINVYDNGAVLGDDVFIVVAPDAFDTDAANYYCSTPTLKFTLSGPSGEVSFEKELNGKIYNGTLKDLDSVPGSMVPLEGVKLCLLAENDLKVSVADTVEYTDYYYEIGTSEANCQTPTASSSKFYAKHGFEVPVENTCNTYYIKVLVRKTMPYVSEVVAKGYLRYWTFGKDSPVADAVTRHATLFPEVGDTYQVGGMNLYRTNATSVSVTQNDDHLVMKTCYLAMNAQVQNDSDAWMYFKVNKNYERGYKLYNDNATYGTTSINAHQVTANVLKDAEDSYGQKAFVWKLGSVRKGFQCGVRGDGTHAYYSMAFLETGDNVTTPVKQDIQAALKVQDCASVPAVVLDSVALAGSLKQGARYWFITGTEGFDAMGDPTTSDSPLTASGISIPVQNKSDRLYIKMLGRCEGCEDVYLKALVRNWKFDVNYIAPTELVSEYDGLTLTLGSNFSDEKCTDARIGYLGVTKGKAEIVPELSGSGWLNANFFSGSYGTTFRMYHKGMQLYSIDMPAKTYYSENDIMKSVKLSSLSKSDALSCEWSYRLWLRNMILLEQTPYTPAQYGSDVSIEDFDGNINYN